MIERPQINTIQKTFKTSNKSAVTTYRWRVDKNPSKVLSLQTAISVVRASVLSFAEEHRRYSVTRSCVHSRAWSQNSDCLAVLATLVDLVALCLKITLE